MHTELRNTRSALRQARTAIPKLPPPKEPATRALDGVIDAVEHLCEAVEELVKDLRRTGAIKP